MLLRILSQSMSTWTGTNQLYASLKLVYFCHVRNLYYFCVFVTSLFGSWMLVNPIINETLAFVSYPKHHYYFTACVVTVHFVSFVPIELNNNLIFSYGSTSSGRTCWIALNSVKWVVTRPFHGWWMDDKYTMSH